MRDCETKQLCISVCRLATFSKTKTKGFELLVACWVCLQRVASAYSEEKVADGSAPYPVAVGECNCAESGTASSKTELASKKLQTTLSDSCSGGGRGV